MRGKLLGSIAASAAAAYFMDPDQGTRRRHMARDRIGGLLRRGARKTEQAAKAGTAQAGGTVQRAKAAVTPDAPPADDRALADRVRTEVFRPEDSLKGKINVDAVDGVVSLRGQVDSVDEIGEVEAQVRGIPGVRDVENLLHTP